MDIFDEFPTLGGSRVAVRINDDAKRWVRSGHPWLYEDSITSVSGEGRPGDLAVIFDRKRDFQAVGLYDPTSPIRVKILHQGKPVMIDALWWEERLKSALARRSSLLASTETTGVRCLNGENDRLPGLVLDKYAQVAVVKIYTLAWLPHLRTIVPQLVALLGVDTVVLRLSRRSAQQAPANIYDGMPLYGDLPTTPVLFRENGLVVEADVILGQKTGYFLDQRDNRRLIGDAAKGTDVLDVFCAGGGFTLAAAAGGARSVLSVDISGSALEATKRNLKHNRHRSAVAACHHRTRKGDAFEVMVELDRHGQRFDIVVVDPPAFAQNEASVAGALRAYRRLTELALPLVRDGGLLFQASCSSRVSADQFFEAVNSGARRAIGVELTELRRTGHPADHIVDFQYGEYLKAMFARVGHTA